jgi:purine-binding chemotaxis protein CheW
MTDYVTFTAAGQLFGLSLDRVRDVFTVTSITRVPLAGPEIAGVLNLRGRIVTVIDLANRLQLQSSRDTVASMVIGLELGPESFGILVDSVTEVLSLPEGEREASRINLDHKLGGVSAGVFRLDQALLVVLDADRILDIRSQAAAA